jgi:hypothetical protein
MLNPQSILIALALCSLVVAAAANAARREYLRRSRERRFSQMVRTAILALDGGQIPTGTENLAWQALETSTGERSC